MQESSTAASSSEHELERSSEKARIFSAAVCFAGVFSFSYFLSEIIAMPLLWYYPLQRRWELSITPSAGLMMGWYGKVLLSLLLATLFSAALYIVLRSRRRTLPDGVQGFLDLLSMSSVVFVLYYIARSLAYRVPGGP